jgi:hypothetical protein
MIENGRYTSLIGTLGDALHPARSPFSRWFLVVNIRFYLDSSGGKPDTPTITAAGYLATEAAWKRFEAAWGRVLSAAGADEFHATDFYACRKKFKHLIKGTDKHARLEKRFLNAAMTHTRYGFGLGFDIRTYRATMTDALKKLKAPKAPAGLDPRVYAISYALSRAAQLVLPRGTQTAVIIEHEAGIGAVIDYMNYLKNKRHEGWTGAYTSFTHALKAERPLQAADLFAYHSCFRVRDTIKDKGAAVRPPMGVLCSRSNIQLYASGEDDFLATVKTVTRFLEEHPEYAMPAE